MGLHNLESNTNIVLQNDPVAKRPNSGHDATHNKAPPTILKN